MHSGSFSSLYSSLTITSSGKSSLISPSMLWEAFLHTTVPLTNRFPYLGTPLCTQVCVLHWLLNSPGIRALLALVPLEPNTVAVHYDVMKYKGRWRRERKRAGGSKSRGPEHDSSLRDHSRGVPMPNAPKNSEGFSLCSSHPMELQRKGSQE